jgi:hypothetical protein
MTMRVRRPVLAISVRSVVRPPAIRPPYSEEER